MTGEVIYFSARDGVRLEGLEQTPGAARQAPGGTRPQVASAAVGKSGELAPGGTRPQVASAAAGKSGEPAPAVVIAHSHPLQSGGHMYAHVLRAVAFELVQRGFVVLSFNFRGVQGSAGEFSDGRDELHDIGGAVDYLRASPHIAPDNIALFGYSFGARVCLPYAGGDARIRAVATLGLPARRFLRPPAELPLPVEERKPKEPVPPAVHVPVLVVIGSADHVLPPDHLERFLALYPNASAHILQGAGHSYRGREAEVGAAVADFLGDLML